jgi:polysaccharide biosynthesis/export protein
MLATGTRAVAVLLALLIGGAGLSPQASAGGAQSPPDGSAALSDYMLGPGDALEITVWGHPDLTREVMIDPGGKIALPLVGVIAAAGADVGKLGDVITHAYESYVLNPQVTVVIKAFRKIHAAALGQVMHPGPYDLQPGARLIDLIAASGGVTDAAALKEARLLRAGRSPETVDLTRVLAGDPLANVPLKGGETLVIPEDLADFVNISGQVVHPGRYRLKGETRVLDALLQAGGLTPNASVAGAKLVRTSGETQSLGLDAMLLDQNMSGNIVLQPGDAMFIPEDTDHRIYVLGDVKTPGVYPLQGKVTMLQAIAMAGGYTLRGPGTAKNAYIIRRGDMNGPVPPAVVASVSKVEPLQNGGSVITANLSAIMHDPAKDIAVQPGDVVVVPQTGVGVLQYLVGILSGIGNFVRW